ncbi:MAG: hypothetical protein AB1589_30905 [Cyanobacteriota bacterium]
MPKYYVCEGSADEGVTQVTPAETPQEALAIAQDSDAPVHFVSTVNPLEEKANETNDR